jgi:ABC-type nitrate/sulfonate/bicarbonate transport system ATPase subunit
MAEGAKRTLLAVRGVTKRLPVGDGEIEALARIDLAIDSGEFVCLIASGCGKSTLLRIIAGFEEPTTGVVSTHGKPITGPGSDRGMVFQDYALFPWMTVNRNIGFGPRQRGLPRAEIAAIADEFVRLVGLERFADRYPNQLSGGMKQRVAIARVLANDANILLMDEPFGALDALTREQLRREPLQIWARTKVDDRVRDPFGRGGGAALRPHPGDERRPRADRKRHRHRPPRPRDVSSPEFNACAATWRAG